MSNEKLARGRAENTARLRRWAESVLAMPAGHHDEDMTAAADHILATTAPPTMADVEWDNKTHILSGATTHGGGDVVMLSVSHNGNTITTNRGTWVRRLLTPNGKRYELREVADKPGHPETLTTVEDYENAPAGTVVAIASRDASRPLPMMKGSDGVWLMKSAKGRFNDHMAGDKRRVLRWGWGA